MKNEIVKYGNELNMVMFQSFTANEMNLFFAIVSRMKDKGTEKIEFSFEDLRYLSNYKPTSTNRFIKDLNSVYDKMLKLTYCSKYASSTKLKIKRFVLFPGFDILADIENGEVNTSTAKVIISVNPDLKDVLNDLGTWTRYSLEEFINLKSSYSKTMFRLLKQFRTTGRYFIKIDDFRELLDIPPSYQVGQIDQKIMTPIKKELAPLFGNFHVKKNKSKAKGNKVLSYTFTWKPEETSDWIDGKFEKPEYKPKASKPINRNTIREVIPESFLTPGTETPLTPEKSLELDLRIAKTQQSWKKGE